MYKALKEIKERVFRIELGLMVADRDEVAGDVRRIRVLSRELLRDVNKFFNTTLHMTGVGKVPKQGE